MESPQHAVSSGNGHPQIATPGGEARLPEPPRILVVDDDEGLCRAMVRTLVHAGFQAEPAHDGEDGWRKLCMGTFHLLVSDQEMPHMTGLQLIAAAREASMHLPVILISGCELALDPAHGASLHIAYRLPKPCSAKKLVETTRSALQLSPHGSSAQCPDDARPSELLEQPADRTGRDLNE